MSDVIIIGSGPAGISASLYTLRAGLKTTIISKDRGALEKAEKIENYYGFQEPVSGVELVDNGVKQAIRLGADIVTDEVVGMGYDGKLIVKTKSSEYKSTCVIIATGATRGIVKIDGINEYEGKGISYCAVCDAFFYRGKDVAVLGSGEYALSEAMELLRTSKSVKLLTNTKPHMENIPDNIEVITNEIDSFKGDNGILSSVSFKDGSSIDVSGVFVAIGVASSVDLARKLGANISNNKIVVNEKMSTNLPGFFAAGDCTGGVLQIAKAVSDGAQAGLAVINYIRNKT